MDKEKKFSRVYVIGVFDLFHIGHVELLRKAKDLGEKLIVAVNGDEMVASYKRRPFYDENDRLEIVKACRYVDEVFIIREFDNKQYIKDLQIDAIVHGDDWPVESYLQQIRATPEFLKQHNVSLVLVPYTLGISTSDLISKIKLS